MREWRPRTSARAGLTFALALAFAVGCSVEPVTSPRPTPGPVAQTGSEATGGGTLRVGLAGDPHSIDPRFVVDEEGELVVGAIFEPLVRLDERDRPTPGAATSWEMDEDGRGFTFTLRDATFHDGTPVTAADVKRTFDRIADGTAEPRSFLSYLVEPIAGSDVADAEGGPLAGVQVVDDRTLRIELRRRDPRYLLTLADPSLVPTPATADSDPAAFAEQPLGNGPFQLAEPREPGAFIRLVRVEEHHRQPRLDEVVFQVYPDDPDRERQWRDLSDGLLQVADLGPDRRDEAVSRFGLASDGRRGPGVLEAPTATVTLLGFASTEPPFDDPAVRRAVSQAIDRQAIAEEVLGGAAIAADGLLPPDLAGAGPGVCDHCRYDPEGAAALVEDAEVDLPPTLTLTTNRGADHAAIAGRVATDVGAALGIEVVVEALDLVDLVPAIREGQARWFRFGWSANEPSAGAYLRPLFASRSSDNLTRFADEEVDDLLVAARSTFDDVEAAELYGEVERRVLEQVAAIPVLVHRRMKVVTPDVGGIVWAASGRVDLAAVTLLDRVDPGS